MKLKKFMTRSVFVAVAVSVGTAFAAEQGAWDGANEVYTITVSAEDADVTLNDDDVAALGADKTLVKAGSGRLIISTDLKTAGYDGEIQIRAGYLRTTVNGALGGVTKGTLIGQWGEGATLEIEDNSTSVAPIHQYEPISFEGVGEGGHGALYVTKAGASVAGDRLFAEGYIHMTGDATVGYSGAESFDGTCAFYKATEFDMGGHTLTFQGGTYDGFTSGPAQNYTGSNAGGFWHPGNITIADGVDFKMAEYPLIRGRTDTNTLTLGKGTKLTLHNSPACYWGSYIWTTSWKLMTTGDAEIHLSGTYWANPGWGGIIHLQGGTLTITSETAKEGSFDGRIMGWGDICVESGTHNFLCVNGASYGARNNQGSTFRLKVNGGKVRFDGVNANPRLMNGEATVWGDAGALALNYSFDHTAGTLTDVHLQKAWRIVGDNSKTALKFKATSASHPDVASQIFHYYVDFGTDYDYTTPFDSPLLVTHGGTGKLGIDTTATALPMFINYADTLEFKSATPMNVNWIESRGGTVSVASGSSVNVASNVYVGADYPNVARFQVKGTCTGATSENGIAVGRGLADCSDARRGIVEVFPGAVLRNALAVYYNATIPGDWSSEYFREAGRGIASMGSYYQYGGEVETPAEDVVNTFAEGNCGYYALKGGTLSVRGDPRFVRRPGVYGVIEQTGGTFSVADGVTFQAGCSGSHYVHYISGGVLQGHGDSTCAAFQLPRPDKENFGNGSRSVFTVDGAGALWDIPVNVNQGWRNALELASQHNSLGQVNLNNGGRLQVNRVVAVKSANAGGSTTTLSGNHSVVSFDGGILDVRYNGHLQTEAWTVFSGFGERDRVYSYGSGATIMVPEVSGHVHMLGAPVVAPSGKGVKSVPLPEAFAAMTGWEYTGSPSVEIVDPTGAGFGATAVANFDTTSGKVTGITVMCPGENYGEGTYAKISRGGYGTEFQTPCELEDNVSGGLVKAGAGTLVVDAVCSYSGETVVEEGTLRVLADHALDASAGVVLEGGVLDLGEAVSSIRLVGGYGSIVNGGQSEVVLSDGLRFEVADLLAKKVVSVEGSVSIPAGAILEVTGDLSLLESSGRRSFKLIVAEGGITGEMPTLPSELADAGWSVDVARDGKTLRLVKHGLAIIVR